MSYEIRVKRLTKTYCGFGCAVHRQALLGRVGCCTTSNNQAAARRLLAKGAEAQLHEIEHGSIVDFDYGVTWFLEFSIGIEGVLKIIAFLRDTCICNGNIDMLHGGKNVP